MKVVVILVNNYSCRDCIHVLATFLDSVANIRKGEQTTAYALFRCGASTLVRREKKQEIEKFTKNLLVLFEAQGDVPDGFPPVNITDGVFGAFRISYTPAVLRFTRHNQEVRYFSYQELFADSIKLKPSFTDEFD